jgi:aspartate carbamoyltransferase catalytic subunit
MEGSARFAAEVSSIPIINAGSGTEEHPTQAMLDLYTMKKVKGKIDDLNIAIVGDLKYGRTVYSLIYGLLKYNSRIYLVSPPSLKVRKEAFFNIHEGISISEYESLDEIIEEIDVIYVTRIQKERFFDPHEYEKVQGSFVLDLNILEKGKKDLIVMHPLPRVGEIHPEVDNSPYAKYFLQTHLGKTVRAALIALMLNSEV